jgi:hypothetical protein
MKGYSPQSWIIEFVGLSFSSNLEIETHGAKLACEDSTRFF